MHSLVLLFRLRLGFGRFCRLRRCRRQHRRFDAELYLRLDELRLLLAQSQDGATAAVALPVYGGSGLRPGVDLEDKEGLDALLEESGERAAG